MDSQWDVAGGGIGVLNVGLPKKLVEAWKSSKPRGLMKSFLALCPANLYAHCRAICCNERHHGAWLCLARGAQNHEVECPDEA